MKRNLMKEAHKMTKEIKEQYPEVDYQAQLGLCLSFLSQKKEEKEMVELKGSEKQIAWANSIRENLFKMLEEAVQVSQTSEDTIKIAKDYILQQDQSVWYIDHAKFMTSNYWFEHKKAAGLKSMCIYLYHEYFDFDDSESRKSFKALSKAFETLENK